MHSISHGSPRTKRTHRYTPESIQRQQASYEYQARRMRSDSAPVDPSQMVYDPHRRRSSMESPQFGIEATRGHHHHGEMKKELSTSSLSHATGPRYQMERSDSAASHSSQSEGYGYGGASPLQFMYAQPAGYMHKHYHERSDSQLSGSSQHSHGDQPDVLPQNRPVHDDPRKGAMPSPRVKKKSKMPKMGINAAMHHHHMQAPGSVQQASPPVSIPQSQSGERFHHFFPQGAAPPPTTGAIDFHSAVPAAMTAVAQHSVHYHVRPPGLDANANHGGSLQGIPSEHIYEILSPDSPTSQDESYSESPSHHGDSPHTENNRGKAERTPKHKHSDSQLSQNSQASQHSLSSQHSDSSLRPNTSDSQRSQSSDDMQLHGHLSRSADQLLPFEKKQTDIRMAKHRQLDDTQIFNVTQDEGIKDNKKKPNRKFDGPPLYENLDFMAKKKREQEQWKMLRDLDKKDKEITGSPVIPQRHRRPRSGSPRSGPRSDSPRSDSPSWRGRMVNGDKDNEDNDLLDKKSSEEQLELDKSFDSDGKGDFIEEQS